MTETSALAYIQRSLSPGLPYKFKIRARNINGEGAFSLEVDFTPVNEPATMEPVTTALTHPNFELTFIEPDNSGLPVLDYQVVFFDKAQNGYRELTSFCNGQDSSLIIAATKTCTFAVTDAVSQLTLARGELL